jgi:hypothetical protein
MRTRLAALVATVACAAVAALAAPGAGAVVVTLRVDGYGAPAPLFEGTVSTQPHSVDGGDGSGSHPCSGSSASTPVPTATGALDDAMRTAGIPWRGNWDPSFRDFFIDRIGPYASAAPDRYWSLTIDERFSAGGCLAQVSAGDSIRFFYGPLFGPGASTSPDNAPGVGSAGNSEGTAAPHGDDSVTRRQLRRVASHALRFLRRQRSEKWARLALAVRGEGDPAAAAAALVGERLDSQSPNGSFGADVNATALAILALCRSQPRQAARAAAWLIAVQSEAGGFGYRPGAPPDVDTTGLAGWALALEDEDAALVRAAAFVRSAQAADGGFPALPGGVSNSQSTGLAAVALRLADVGPRRALAASGRGPLDYLLSLVARNGSIAYRPHSSPTPAWTTAQALLGLTSRAKLLDWRSDGSAG